MRILSRNPNPGQLKWEVAIVEPPLLGQYETTVGQSGTWRTDDSLLIPRQEQFARSIARILGHGSHLGRTVSTRTGVNRLLADAKDGAPLFFLPHMTICGSDAWELPLTRQNFYGGCVSSPHQGTKVIMRRLVGPNAERPEGWNQEFAEAISRHAIPGFAVFDPESLREAVERVLDQCGRARIKLATGADGEGQFILENVSQSDEVIRRIEAICPLALGASVEADIVSPTLYGVCSEWIGGLQISFVGEYTRDNTKPGREIGLGTCDEVVLGPLSALDLEPTRLADHPYIHRIVEIAADFDAQIELHLKGVLVTRRQHQFIVGEDARGTLRIGTLEQSWRRGGITANTLLAAETCLREGLEQVSTRKFNYYRGPCIDGMWRLYSRPDGTSFMAEITDRHR